MFTQPLSLSVNIFFTFFPVALSTKNKSKENKSFRNFLQYADGTNSLEKISNLIQLNLNSTKKIYKILLKNNLIN